MKGMGLTGKKNMYRKEQTGLFVSWFFSLLVGWAVQIDLYRNQETTENKDGNLASSIIAHLTWSV